jgi:PKD repeat protein
MQGTRTLTPPARCKRQQNAEDGTSPCILGPDREVSLRALSSHLMIPASQSWSLMKLLRLSSGMMAGRAKNRISLLPFVLFWAASATFLYADNPVPTCSLSVTPPGGRAPLNVTASGGCTDHPKNDIVDEGVDWGDGSKTAMPPESFASFTIGHTFAAAGTFTVVLTAIDSVGNQGTSSQQIVVTPPNAPPSCTLKVAPSSGPAPLVVTANGTCTDPENDIVSAVITWGDGSSTIGTSGTHTFSSPGSSTVTLTATDSAGNTGSASQTVTVGNPNVPPTCALSVAPGSGPMPLTVSADGNCSDPENDIVSMVINWGDGASTQGASGTHTYPSAGRFHVVLTATDSAGGTGSASQTVVVGPATNAPPTCSMQLSSTSGKAPLTVTVDANCTDPENDIKSTVIDFDDGFYAAGTTTHTFVRAGAFSLTVVATDSVGNVSNTASGTVSVSDDPTLFVGVSNGQIKDFDQSGNVINTLNTGRGGSVTGMSFDWVDNLYVTDFTANGVTKFAGTGTVVGDFGAGYNCKPESIVFDRAGNAYVGETGCSHALLKFDSYGNLLASFQVTTETEGSDWIDLAADQCTILYTSQGTSVFSFNACTNKQGPSLTTGLNTGLGLRILPDGGALIADKQDIVRLDSAGRVITRYNSSGESCWVSLTLDPDGKSFWAVDYCTSDIIRFDITSGNQLTKFNSGTPTQTVFGIGMRGATIETTPAGPLTASPPTISVAAGQSASLQLTFSPSSAAMNQSFTFTCANLPIGAKCSLSPATVMPTTSVSVNVSITTTGGSAGLTPSATSRVPVYAIWLLVPNLILLSNTRRTRKNKRLLFLGAIVVTALMASLLACGSSSRGSTGSSTGSPAPTPGSMTTPAATYPIVIQAKSNSLVSSTVVNLSVQ